MTSLENIAWFPRTEEPRSSQRNTWNNSVRNHAVMRADLARHRHPRKAFQEMFVAAASRWASGDFDDD